MMNTPNVIKGCSYENHILKIDNLESATKLYREMLKFHIKLDTIKYEENLKDGGVVSTILEIIPNMKWILDYKKLFKS